MDEDDKEHATRLCKRLAAWYADHLGGQISMVVLTHDTKLSDGSNPEADPNVTVMTLKQYLERFHPNDSVLWGEYNAALEAEAQDADNALSREANDLGYTPYVDEAMVLSGINTDVLVRGRISVFKCVCVWSVMWSACVSVCV